MEIFTQRRLEELHRLIESLDTIGDFEILPGLKVHDVYRSKRVRNALRQTIGAMLDNDDSGPSRDKNKKSGGKP